MAKTKKVTVNGQEFELQSVSPSWYYDFNDECGNTGSGKRKSAKYMDGMFKNCVISVAKREFWSMVYSGNGITYSELKGMDLAEYREAVEAKLLYMEKWLPEAREKAKSRQ